MYFVYSLQSESEPDRYYVGITSDVERRVKEHNRGICSHSNKYKPWKLISYTAFEDQVKAERFEIYLKSGSGRTFSKRHF